MNSLSSTFRPSPSAFYHPSALRRPPSTILPPFAIRLPQSRSGIALISILWISVLLSFAVYAVMLAASMQAGITENHAAELVARQAALSGIDRASELLDQDLEAGGIDSLEEDWSGGGTEIYQDVRLGTLDAPVAYYSLIRLASTDVERQEPQFGIADEASRININVAPEDVLTKLPGMTTEVARSIQDWRDADDDVREEGGESEYYSTLTPSYQARNGPFETLHELLFVKGVTEELFYGEDTNLNGILDPNENDGDRSPPNDNSDGELNRGFFHWCTVWSYDLNVTLEGNERVDLNADSVETMRTEFAGVFDDNDLAVIVARRQRQPFASIGELLQLTNAEAVAAGGRRRGPPDPTLLLRPITREKLMKVADKMTIGDEKRIPGRINILTAPKEVLAGLPGMNDSRADAVINLRGGDAEFRSIAEILSLNEIPDETFVALAPWITVRSFQFRVDSVGRSADRPVFRRYWGVYDRAPETPRYVYLKEISSHGLPYEVNE